MPQAINRAPGAPSSMVAVAQNRWGDLLEEEEELPAPTTTGPDGKGIVTRVEYFRNDKGEVMKRTTRTKVIKIKKKVFQVRRGPQPPVRVAGP